MERSDLLSAIFGAIAGLFLGQLVAASYETYPQRVFSDRTAPPLVDPALRDAPPPVLSTEPTNDRSDMAPVAPDSINSVPYEPMWRGLGGNTLVSSADYESIVPGARRLEFPDPQLQRASDEQLDKGRRSAEEFALALHSEQLTRDAALGPGPYLHTSFQVIGFLDQRWPVTFGGVDFEVPASPEDSLVFFCHENGNPGRLLPEPIRQSALELLREWQVVRRQHLRTLVASLMHLATGHEPPRSPQDYAAYAVVHGKLLLLRREECAALERCRQTLAETSERLMAELADIVRGS